MLTRLTPEQRRRCMASFLYVQKTHLDQLSQIAANNGLLLLKELRMAEQETDKIQGELVAINRGMAKLKGKR